MSSLIEVPKLCMMIELGFKYLHKLDFKSKRSEISKFLEDLEYIPLGLETIAKHYCLLAHQKEQ